MLVIPLSNISLVKQLTLELTKTADLVALKITFTDNATKSITQNTESYGFKDEVNNKIASISESIITYVDRWCLFINV